jgi:hypothetical protein
MMSARTSKFDQITLNTTMHTFKRIAINAAAVTPGECRHPFGRPEI